MRRARITSENARRMYEDLLDRVVADREEGRGEAAREADESTSSASRTQPRRRERPDSRPEDNQPSDRPRIKATFYLMPEDIVIIDRIQTQEFIRTGKKPQRSEIVSRAIQLLGLQELSEDLELPEQ